LFYIATRVGESPSTLAGGLIVCHRAYPDILSHRPP
jgi:hypothetical protein